MVKISRRDFLKMAGAFGVGVAAAFGAFQLGAPPKNMLEENQRARIVKSSPHTWVRFLATANETTLSSLTMDEGGRLDRYRVREVVPVRGEVPADLAQGWSAVQIETSVPISLSEESLSSVGSSVIQFYGVTQNLHYTSDAQRQELTRRSRSAELEASEHTTAVLIPIGKSEEWWKLAQDQRQAYFQRSDTHEGHTAIGLKYADRVFRKLYHSRHLNAVLSYDFLTYFEFEDVYENDFRSLLAELRDTRNNPEWAYVNHEFEIWMTKIG
ncbi:MAG: twin-arginine translocation signal domain-containing protein [Nitrososphaerales archaeon]